MRPRGEYFELSGLERERKREGEGEAEERERERERCRNNVLLKILPFS